MIDNLWTGIVALRVVLIVLALLVLGGVLASELYDHHHPTPTRKDPR